MVLLMGMLACLSTQGADVQSTWQVGDGVFVDPSARSARVDGRSLRGADAMVAVATKVVEPLLLARAALALVDDGAAAPWTVAIGGAYPQDVEAMAAAPRVEAGRLTYWRTAAGTVADLARCSVELSTGQVSCINGAELRPPEVYLASGDVYVRLRGVAGLERDHRTTDLMATALNDPDPRVRSGAVAALGRSRASGVTADVCRVLLLDGYPEVRLVAATTLGALNDPAAVDSLRRAAAGDADAGVRSAASAALLTLAAP